MAARSARTYANNEPMSRSLHLRFDEGNREAAQQAADKDFRGNLTAYLNHIIEQDAKRRNKRKP